MGDFHVGSLTGHNKHFVALNFHQRGVVGDGQARIQGMLVGLTQQGQVKSLGCLHRRQPGARQGSRNTPVVHHFDSVSDGQTGNDRGRAPAQGLTNAAYQGRAQKGAGRVMHQHVPRPMRQDRQTQAHGILAQRAAGRHQPRQAEILSRVKGMQALFLGGTPVRGENKNNTGHHGAAAHGARRVPIQRGVPPA